MASGTIKTDGFYSARFNVPASSTRYLSFPSGLKNGIIFTSGASNKRGVYIYGSTSSSGVNKTDIYAITQSGTGISETANANYLTITNGSTGMYVLVIAYFGSLPTLESTLPT